MTPETAKPPEADQRDKKPRHRSPNYPAIGLRSAVDKITAIYEADGLAPCLRDAALKHMGFEKAHGEAARVLSALKSFGLIEETDGRVNLAQRGIDIVARDDADELRVRALSDAATSPEIYRELLRQYKDSGLPSDTALRSELIAVKRFNPNAVGDFIREFSDTLEFAGLSDIRVIDWNLEHVDVRTQPQNKPQKGPLQLPAPPDRTSEKSLVEKAAERMMQARTRSYSWALSGELTAKLDLVGVPQSEEDLEALRDYVDITIKALGRSMKKAQSEGGQ
jgi:hypothetical protein